MAVFLSPGVMVQEIDQSIVASGIGNLTPAFIGVANKGPLQEPVFISTAQQYIDTFGNPFPESYLGYAVLAFFEVGSTAWVMRVGVECETGQVEELSSVCIDTSGAKGNGWGRIPIFSGIAPGKICSRVISSDAPLTIHQALVSNINFTDASLGTDPANATLNFSNVNGYTGAIDDNLSILFSGEVTANHHLDGLTITVTRNSDGHIVYQNILTESSTHPGHSQLIDIGDGLVFTIVANTGNGPIVANDSILFQVQPDNRSFNFNVNRTTSGAPTSTLFVLPDATHVTPETLATAINNLIDASPAENYKAVPQDDGTVCVQTITSGQNIQIVGSEAFCLDFGVNLYAYDIPRSNIQSTVGGPYDIISNNNRVTIRTITSSTTFDTNISLQVKLSSSASDIALSLNAGGLVNGDRVWNSYAMEVPGEITQVFIETSVSTTNHQFDQIRLLADLSHPKSLAFAETLDVLYPYYTPYKVFNDLRTILPDSGVVSLNIPASCDANPDSDACLADSLYFANIVGWLVAASPGTWISSYTVSLQPYLNSQGLSQNAAGLYTLTVFSGGVVVNVTNNITFDPREAQYIGNVINAGSVVGGANGNLIVQWIPRPGFLNNDPVNDLSNFEVRLPGILNNIPFVGQADGIPQDPAFSSYIDDVTIGNPGNETGLYAFQNPDVYNIDLLVIPGASSGAVIGQGLQLCETRGDVLFIIDPPFGLRAQQVVDWSNGMLYSDLGQSLDSSYGALYHPWLEVADQFNGGNIFIPPSGHVSAVYARTANVAEVWFAPAGLTRGRLLTPIDVEVNLTQGERDLMYGYNNSVNPIVNFPKDGIVVWGQKTLQRVHSALDRVNVRMLLIQLRKDGIQLLRPFVFEINDEITRLNITTASNSYLADIQSRRGIYGFQVVCDGSNNSPQRIDNNLLYVSWFIKPSKVAEFIQLDIVTLQTSASFTTSVTAL